MIEPLSDKEKVFKDIIEKIDYVLSGINKFSTYERDHVIAQTVKDLSEAYKNLMIDETEDI